MNFRKKIKISKQNQILLTKVDEITLIPKKENIFRKLDIKIFSASKYTPSYDPFYLADIYYPEKENDRLELPFQNEKNHQVTQENDEENWQKFVSTSKLSLRGTNILLKNFSSCEEFLSCNENSLRTIRNCGRKTIRELIEFRNDIVIEKAAQSGEAVANRPKKGEEALRLPPSEKNIPFLPIFSSKPLVDFVLNDLHPQFYGTSLLHDFVFSARASKIFKRLGLKTIGEVMLLPPEKLLSQKNFGRKCLKEVQDILRSFILAGGISRPANIAREGSEFQLDIDYSSYENLVASFVRHCLEGERNQAIVCGRFDFPNAMPTLEQLGKRFGITRERVRQILKQGNALLRVKAHRVLLKDFWELVVKIIHDGGGIITLRELTASLRNEYRWPDLPNSEALAELLSVAKEEKVFTVSGDVVTTPCPCLSCETPGGVLSSLDFEVNESYHLLVVGEKLVRQCQSMCEEIYPPQRFHKAFLEKIVGDSGGAYQLHGDLVFTRDLWLLRHGEKLENLIVYVLENHGKPMHFSEIAAIIRRESIKHREISNHNVHAAMIRYDSIEIIQRGTYGLKAWGAGGYRSVSTAIEELLEKHSLPMRRSEIIKCLADEFSEQNISTALHNWSNRFLSIGEGFYDRPEKWRKRTVTGLIELLPEKLTDLARFITSNNNCSYKLVLALVFIRGMDEKGAYYLPTLKERFYNFYLGRHRKGEVVEAENVLMRRIGELDAAEIRNKAIRRPFESFLASGLWIQKYSSLYLQEDLVGFLAAPTTHSLLLVILLKGIDDYFVALSPQAAYPPTAMVEVQTREILRSSLDDLDEDIMNSPDESTISISIKKKNRGKIEL